MLTEWKKIYHEFFPALPGLNLVFGVALVSRNLQSMLPPPTLSKAISEVLIAVALGLYIHNVIKLSPRWIPGIKFALNRVLCLGIILLGLRLSLQDVADTGFTSLMLILVCISVALLLAYLAGKIFNIPPRLAALIGVGTAICGNTAIVATAPVIEAEDEDISFAVATITLFGTLAVVVYPLIGQSFGFTDKVFGLWAGTAVNDTSQVVAVGAAFSAAALNVATIVKLTRNTLMAPILVFIGFFYNRVTHHENRASFSRRKFIPGFVLGFLLLSLVRTSGVALGWLPQSVDEPGDLQAAASALKILDEVAKFSILMALSAVGLNTNVQSMSKIGLKPFVVGLCVALVLAGLSLSLILFTGLGN